MVDTSQKNRAEDRLSVQIVCVHTKMFIPLQRQKENNDSVHSISIKFHTKGKKIMVFTMTFAVVAIMVAQAINVENKL